MTYQPLISGENIKTIDNQSILGSGNITSGGTSQPDYTEVWLKFNGANNSTDFINESKNNYLIIPYGSPIISTTESKFSGSSLYLNGNSYLSLPSINFDNDFTFECWVKRASLGGIIALITQDINGAYQYGSWWLLFVDQLFEYYSSIHANIGAMLSANYPQDLDWHHVALVRNNYNFYLYVDGVVVSTLENRRIPNPSSFKAIDIGLQNGANRYLNGYIDNLRISSKAIYTPTLYPNGFTLPDESFNVTAL